MSSTRILGEVLPASLSTALPFENLVLFSDIKKYRAIYVSVETLTRNTLSCLENKNPTIKEVFDSVLDDIQNIGMYLKNNFGYISLFLYTTTNKSLRLHFPYSKFCVAITEKQRVTKTIVTSVEALVKKHFSEIVISCDCFVIPESGYTDGLIMTSFPTQLLGQNKFNRVALLESYTGKIKLRPQWNSKLTNGSKHGNIPFNKFSLSVFGDNNKLLKPMDQKTRAMVSAIAIKGTWSASSTRDLLIEHMKANYTLENKQQLLSLL